MERSHSDRLQRMAVAALSFAMLLPACTDSQTGTLIIPVQQRTSDGAVYHLTGMLHVISADPQGQVDLNSAGRSESFEVERPPGLTFTTMANGWSLERASDASAMFEIVPATWLNDSGGAHRIGVVIEEGRATTVQFEFQVHGAEGDRMVTLGAP